MPYDNKADVWSLGCILYEMCSLKPPFDASNMTGLIVKITRGEYEPIPEAYSKELSNFVAALLTVEASKRPTINEALKYKFLKPHIERALVQYENIKKCRLQQNLKSQEAPNEEKPTVGELIEQKMQALEQRLGKDKLMLLYTSVKVAFELI